MLHVCRCTHTCNVSGFPATSGNYAKILLDFVQIGKTLNFLKIDKSEKLRDFVQPRVCLERYNYNTNTGRTDLMVNGLCVVSKFKAYERTFYKTFLKYLNTFF